MSIRELWNRVSQVFRRERATEELEEEMRLHIELRAEANRNAGMSAADVSSDAHRRFGNRTELRMSGRDAWSLGWVETVVHDFRYAWRMLARSPSFTIAAVATLALGIGANSTMFGVIDTLLFKAPAHVRDPGQVSRLYFGSSDAKAGGRMSMSQGYSTYTTLRERVRGFESLGAYWATKVSIGSGEDARSFPAVLATPSFFNLLGVRPAIGRFFADDEEREDRGKVAVLGFDVWRAKYAGDSGILGRTIDVGGARYRIVGVAPRGFTGVDLPSVDLWLPIGAATRLFGANVLSAGGGGNSYWLSIVGRKRAGISDSQLAAEATAAYLDWRRPEPMFERFYSSTRVLVGPILVGRGPAAGSDVRVAVWLGAVSLIVLLIACANVASLMLARGLDRAREMAIRLSLGATRVRLARQLLIEGMLLSAIGAVGAILLARMSSTAMVALFIPSLALDGGVLDWRLWSFVALIALAAGMLAAAAPAIAAMRQDFDAALRVGVADSSGRRPTLRRALVSGQVALTLLLLIGSGLFVTSLRHVQGIDLGIEASHLVYANVDLASRGMAAPDANARYATMLTKVRQLPGVQSASLSAGEPLASGWAISLQARDAEPPKPGEMTPFGQAVGSGYFETMGATLRAGRFFTEIDQSPVARVAIIDEATAQHFWPHGDALGACARLGSDGDCTAIVGIIANTVRWQVTGDRGFTVYVPLESKFAHRVSMMEIRTDRDPAELVSSIRRAMQSTAPDMPFADIQPVSRRLAPQIRPWQLGAAMFSVYGALALVLASIGLYGLLSFMVSQRTREIGLRRALGAPERSVVALVVRSAAGMTIVGVLVGAIAAIPAGRLVASELYGISPHDVRVFALGAAVLTVVGLLASFIPARRAARIDPMDALRAD